MKWLKDNWLKVAIIFIIFIFIGNWKISFNRKRELRLLSNSIEVLEHEYHVMQDSLTASKRIILAYQIREGLYQDSINTAKRQIKINNVKHEIQVANLTAIPTDSLYSELTRWLDNLSFQ